MRAALLLVVGAALAGCPGPTDPATPDGAPPSDSVIPSIDAPQPGAARLIIAWATTPAVPGTTAAGNEIEDARFRMEDLKATVDVDPNNPNTAVDEYKLRWDGDEGPASIVFENAPVGRYTSIVFQLDDGDNEKSFDLRGNAPDDDSFRFDDSASLSIAINCDVMLLPGQERTVVIDIDLQTAVDEIDIEGLDSGDGVDHHLDAEEEPEAMAQFRSALQQAFSVREP